MTYYYEPELYHHGIKGQKWGIRRFQNEDGSLTPEGERRYSDSQKKILNKHYEDVKSYDSIRDGLTIKDSKNRDRVIFTRDDVKKLRNKSIAKRDDVMVKFEKKNSSKAAKLQKIYDRIQSDIDSFKPIENGLTDKSGRVILTADDVHASVAQLVKKRDAVFSGQEYLKEYLR